ncbi:hypothetical protein MRB53_040699 [Persea americana]|nr:hypothetical protein MRB53_040699 [Persea americana]
MPKNASRDRALAAIAKDGAKKLEVAYDGNAITTGQYIGRAECSSIAFDVPDRTAKYIVVALDLDAPFQSFTVLGPILHWIQPGFRAAPDGRLTSSEPFVAKYIGPAPPPGSGPHRYTFYLFVQPKDFDGKKYAPADGKPLSTWLRMRWFDRDAWIRKVGAAVPIAANYFTSN